MVSRIHEEAKITNDSTMESLGKDFLAGPQVKSRDHDGKTLRDRRRALTRTTRAWAGYTIQGPRLHTQFPQPAALWQQTRRVFCWVL